MKISKKVLIIFLCAVVVIIGYVVYQVVENKKIDINEISIKSDKIPKSFSDFRIAQVSDFHNAEFGENNINIVQKLKSAKPDIIVITGDLIDSRNTKIDVALDFSKQCVEIAPTYYVTGNHESRIDDYEVLKKGLLKSRIKVLENEVVSINNKGESIYLAGLIDPAFKTVYPYDVDKDEVISSKLKELINEDNYTILLSHRPELFETYVKSEVDLVFSGHAHGGQIRLPFIGGLAAPHQGLFPHYDSGKFTEGNTNMIVSRGLGNSLFPLRVNNRPEIIVAVLNNK